MEWIVVLAVIAGLFWYWRSKRLTEAQVEARIAKAKTAPRLNGYVAEEGRKFNIAGIHYRGRAVGGFLLGKDYGLRLRRASENVHDKNAVAILTMDLKEIGFVPRNQNKDIALAMDEDLDACRVVLEHVKVKSSGKGVHFQVSLWWHEDHTPTVEPLNLDVL